MLGPQIPSMRPEYKPSWRSPLARRARQAGQGGRRMRRGSAPLITGSSNSRRSDARSTRSTCPIARLARRTVVVPHEMNLIIEDELSCKPVCPLSGCFRLGCFGVIEEVRFAGDSPLEQAGFELPVPPARAHGAAGVRRDSEGGECRVFCFL